MYNTIKSYKVQLHNLCLFPAIKFSHLICAHVHMHARDA